MFLMVFASNAQIVQSLKFTNGSLRDREKIMHIYLLPVEKSFIAINRSGLIFQENSEDNSGVALKLTLDFTRALAPISDKNYEVNQRDLQASQPSACTQTIAQTFAGNGNMVQLLSKAMYRVPTRTSP
jgi:ribonucleotide monophosphatase NagD (HAD superfamily)